MDMTLTDEELTPALREALVRAVEEGGSVRVTSVVGGYRLVAERKQAVGDQFPRGSARLGQMQHLGLTLDDLE